MTINDTIGAKIRKRRKAAGMTLTQLEQLTGIDNGNLSRIERGKQSLNSNTLEKLAKAFGVSVAELLETLGDRINAVEQHEQATIPYRVFCSYKQLTDLPRGANILVSRIAVIPTESRSAPKYIAWQLEPERPLLFNADNIRQLNSKPSSLVAVAIIDNTMAPRLFDGDSVLVDTSETTVPDSSGVFALVYGDDLVLRRVFKRPGGGYILKCDNQDFPMVDVPRDQAEKITIIGRVKYRSGVGDF